MPINVANFAVLANCWRRPRCLLATAATLQVLTFVCMRLETPVKPDGRGAEGVFIRVSLSHVVSGSSLASPGSDVSPQLARQLFEALATCTMQFRGYIHLVRENQVRNTLLSWHHVAEFQLATLWRGYIHKIEGE